MVEVFKTNVEDLGQASQLLEHIHKAFAHCQANFDLEDCDKILRIKCTEGFIQPASFIELLKDFGFAAEVLPDDL